MHPTFARLIAGLHSKYEQLISMPPCKAGALPKMMPKQGVYLFSEGGHHLYVGRSNNIRGRYGTPLQPRCDPQNGSFCIQASARSDRQDDRELQSR